MAARYEQQQIGKGEGRLGEHRRQGMAFEMVHRDQRLARREREALGRHQPDHHAADQSRAGGCRHGVDVREPDIRLQQRSPDQVGQDFDMGAGGDLGDDAAIGPVSALLPRYAPREDASVARHQRNGRFVA